MIVFGWLVLVCLALYATLAISFVCLFGGEEFSSRSFTEFLVGLAIIIFIWYFVCSWCPFVLEVKV